MIRVGYIQTFVLNNINFKLEKFEGPLHLLLELIESEELPISEVALGQVTDQFLAHVEHATEEVSLEIAVDFLHIASRLLYVKSRYVLSAIAVSEDEDDVPLEAQLKLFRAYQEASKLLDSVVKERRTSFARQTLLTVNALPEFLQPAGVTKEILAESFAGVVSRITFIRLSKRAVLEKVLSIREKIEYIKSLIERGGSYNFRSIVGDQFTKSDVVVSFLAMLELAKQRILVVEQEEMFQEITVRKNGL